jgi:hypothetical protein
MRIDDDRVDNDDDVMMVIMVLMLLKDQFDHSLSNLVVLLFQLLLLHNN